jgi:two-component system, sporulation sensor kinase E
MSSRKKSSLDRILGRLDNLDSVNLSNLVQRLIKERRFLEAVIDVVQNGILVINAEGTIQFANQQGCRLIGLKEKDIGHATLWKIVPALARTLDLRHEDGKAEPSMISREVRLTYPENKYVRLHVVPIEGTPRSRRGRSYAVILADVTDDKLSTEELIENEKTSSVVMLAAGVAHELGNPLNSLNIHLQLMGRLCSNQDDEESAKLRKSLDICSDEVKRLDRIISNFLEAIRPAEPDFNPVDLLAILESVLRLLEVEFEEKNVNVKVEVSEKAPSVHADSDQIKQVFFNVIKNAVDAMGKNPRLKIFLRSDEENVYLQFADSGKGISKEDLSKVFQPYFTTKKDGHGLGMMIVHRIMRSHGGHVGIDSKQGTGTVVSLQFPHADRSLRLLET